jgi:hypothetical protein
VLAGTFLEPQLYYLHTASAVSRNPEGVIYKALRLIGTSEISLNNQDKVENAISALSAVLKKPC